MKNLSQMRLYGILDLGITPIADAERVTSALIEGGIDILQIRAKNSDEAEIESVAHRIVPLTESASIPLIINDFPQLVPSVGAQGAHLGQGDFSISDGRWRAGRSLAGEVPPPIIGRSTHSFDQAVEAENQGADYIGFGPLYPTPTKPGRPAIGLDDIRKVHHPAEMGVELAPEMQLNHKAMAVQAGALAGDVYLLYGSAALQQVTSIHRSISKD